MRNILLLLMVVTALSCQKDDDIFVPGDDTLHYDGANLSAPVLAQGISYTAIKFSGDDIIQMGHQGKTLTAVDFYLDQRPEAIRVIVFDWNTNDPDEPGQSLYEFTINNSDLREDRWNQHKLGKHISLPDAGIWIALEIDAGDQNLSVIGCDPGPADLYGDIYGIFGGDNPGWTSFYDFSNQEIDINWNIRGEVE